jgi:hypothetical protein
MTVNYEQDKRFAAAILKITFSIISLKIKNYEKIT